MIAGGAIIGLMWLAWSGLNSNDGITQGITLFALILIGITGAFLFALFFFGMLVSPGDPRPR
jgi:hypothetical protein